QRVLELVELAVASLRAVTLTDHITLHALRSGPLPLKLRTVDPRENDVDVEADVTGEFGEHALDGGPAATVQLDAGAHSLGQRKHLAHERVGVRRHNVLTVGLPELQPNAGCRAEREPALRLHARAEERERPRLGSRGECAV